MVKISGGEVVIRNAKIDVNGRGLDLEDVDPKNITIENNIITPPKQ